MLMKDHKMGQIINDIYLLFLRIMNLASFKKKIDLFIFKNLRLYPLSPPPPSIKICMADISTAVLMSMTIMVQ